MQNVYYMQHNVVAMDVVVFPAGAVGNRDNRLGSHQAYLILMGNVLANFERKRVLPATTNKTY